MQKQPPVVIAQQAISYSVLVAENHQKFRSGCWVHEFFQTLKKNCGSFHSLWLWLLIAIMKRCAEPSALQLHCTSLIYVNSNSKVTENIFNFLEWLQNTQNCKSLSKQNFIFFKTFIAEEKTKNYQERPNFGSWSLDTGFL